MSTPKPQDIPLYNLSEISRWVGVPPATIRSWAFGRKYWADGREKLFQPLFKIADPTGRRLSFSNIAEAHILAATRRNEIAMADVRAAIDMLQADDRHADHPLLTGKFFRNGKRLFVEFLNEKIAASKPIQGQRPLGDLLDAYLERIVRDDRDHPVRLFPMPKNDNRSVMLDFTIAGGQPVVVGTGILVEFLRARKNSGESIKSIAEDYGLSAHRVAEAINYLAA